VQLENVTVPGYLNGFKVLLLTYQGMKPLSPEVHMQLAHWVKSGGVLVMCDDDSDPFNSVREWWNSNGLKYRTPREHLFEQLDFKNASANSKDETERSFGKGRVIWSRENPTKLAHESNGPERVESLVHRAADLAKLKWRETNYLLLRRGPYIIAAGLDESIPGATNILHGRFINLFDAQLRMQTEIRIEPGGRYLLRDLDFTPNSQPQVLESACKALVSQHDDKSMSMAVEGVGETPAVVLLQGVKASPRSITLDGEPVKDVEYSGKDKLLWVHFANEARPRVLSVQF
jgi:hypothetical protein